MSTAMSTAESTAESTSQAATAHRRPTTSGGARPTHTRSDPAVCGYRDVPAAAARLAALAAHELTDAAAAAVQEAEADAAPWMPTALGEIGVAELRGLHNANPRILEYFKASGYWGKDDSGARNAWCGSFVAWVMQKNNIAPVRHAYRAKAWIDFGRKLEAPVYGAIGIKSRKGGGHVAFIVGQSADGASYYMLGGNQQDKVQILRYPRHVWTTFVVPPHYDAAGRRLPIRTDTVPGAGTEA